MRFIHVYVAGYFALAIGAALTLWQVGALARISGIWLGIAPVIIVGLGITLLASSGRPTTIANE